MRLSIQTSGRSFQTSLGWGGGVYITYQASSELEDSHTEKPETHPEGQDRRSQDTAAIAPGLTSGQESRQKGSPAGNQLGNAAGHFLPRLFAGIDVATIPSPNQDRASNGGCWGHITLVSRVELLLCDTPRVSPPVSKA